MRRDRISTPCLNCHRRADVEEEGFCPHCGAGPSVPSERRVTRLHGGEEVTAMLADMGLKRVQKDRHPFWQRWKCRIFGPHEWVSVQRLIPSTGALVEEGLICCHNAATT